MDELETKLEDIFQRHFGGFHASELKVKIEAFYKEIKTTVLSEVTKAE